MRTIAAFFSQPFVSTAPPREQPRTERSSSVAVGSDSMTSGHRGLSAGQLRLIESEAARSERIFLNQLEAWRVKGDVFEQRDEAVRLIIECRQQGSEELMLSQLNLRSVPDCIGELHTVKHMALNHNRLDSLPPGISRSRNLCTLLLLKNQFTDLPGHLIEMPSLTFLVLDHNEFEEFPECLRDIPNLKALHFKYNKLRRLPNWLPEMPALQILYLENNKIREVPENIARMKNLIDVNFAGNELADLPVSIWSMTKMLEATRLGPVSDPLDPPIGHLKKIRGFQMPRRAPKDNRMLVDELFERALGHSFAPVLSQEAKAAYQAPAKSQPSTRAKRPPIWEIEAAKSAPVTKPEPALRPDIEPGVLQGAVEAWYQRTTHNYRSHALIWQSMEKEQDAGLFARFLNDLTGTATYKNLSERAQFIKRVTGLLDDIGRSPSLRQLCFSIVEEEITSKCGDRTALALNNIEHACMCDKAERGEYTMTELFLTRRSMSRLRQLEKFANQDIAAAKAGEFIDPLEVHLGYQTLLGYELSLPNKSTKMRHEAAANLTLEDLSEARRRVVNMERSGEFITFIAEWEPWQKGLIRDNPDDFKNLQEQFQIERTRIAVKPRFTTDSEWLVMFDKQAANEALRRLNLCEHLTRELLPKINKTWWD